MCDIGNGSVTASQSQPANLYAQYALTYAVDAAKGVKLAPGQPGGGAPALANVSYNGDTNLADPIVAPFVTKAAGHPHRRLPGRRPARHRHHAPRSPTRPCGATCTAPPTAVSAPRRKSPDRRRGRRSGVPATCFASTNGRRHDGQRPGARRDDRRREAVRHAPRALRGVDLSLRRRSVPGSRRPQRRGQVDHRLHPVRPAEPDAGQVRFGGSPAPRVGRRRPLARVDRDRLPALDDRARPDRRRERVPRRHRDAGQLARAAGAGRGRSCATGASTSRPDALVPGPVGRAAADRRDRAGAGPRRQVRAARRAHRRARARRGAAAVRARPPARRRRRGRPLHLASP